MNEHNLLKDLLLLLAFSIPIIYLFNKINLPSIFGFIVTGIIIGPNFLQLIKSNEGIVLLSEIGVALLLFSVGVEISFNNFIKNFKEVLFVGGLQVIATILIGFLIGTNFGFSVQQSLFIGFLITHSSTAIILKMLSDRDELDTPHGKLVVGTLVFQDLMVLPMLLLIPILGLANEVTFGDASIRLIGSFSLIVIIFLISKFLMPHVLYFLIQIQMRDVFIIGVIVFSLGTAFLTNYLGLSFAIGAFIAGLIISETEYTHQVISDIIPFKEVFTSFFFLSFGMLFDLNFAISRISEILILLVVVMILKTLIITGIISLLKYPHRISLLSGIFLSQIGEFSFVIAMAGLDYNLLSEDNYKLFVSVTIFSMLISPLLLKATPHLASKIPKIRTTKSIHKLSELKNHVIVIGYGLNGKNVSKVLSDAGIPYIVIEANPKYFQAARDMGENVIIGDATKREILLNAHIEQAKVVVVAISDSMATRIITKTAKQLNKEVYLIVRTRYVTDVDDLLKLGADEVIPEEFETSIQILSRVLKRFHIPNSVILAQANTLRTESYGIFRDVRFTENAFDHINQILAKGTIDTVYVNEDSKAINKTLQEINLRAKTGATVISVVRNNEFIPNPSGDFKVERNDLLVLFGTHNAIDRALEELNSKTE